MNSFTTIPAEADKVMSIVTQRLEKSLLAVYLHGSAVVGGLRPRSDVDLLVVVDQPLNPEVRRGLVADLMKVSGRYPFDPEGRRPVELMVFLHSDLTASLYPVRSEFIYGEWLRHGYEADFEAGNVPQPVRDPELTLVLAQARQEAISLLGPDRSYLLPAIPQSDILHAMKDALPALIDSTLGDERNVLLTLARMWRTCVTGEFVAKDVAADWAVKRLPTKQGAVLTLARESYLNGCEENWQSRQQELQLTISSLHELVLANL